MNFAAMFPRCGAAATLAAGALVIALGACGTPGSVPAGVTPMSGAEIEALLARHGQWTFESSDGATGEIARAPDGSVQLAWSSGGSSGQSPGRMWVERDLLCSQYRDVRGGARSCGPLVRLDADRYHLHADTGRTSTFTVKR